MPSAAGSQAQLLRFCFSLEELKAGHLRSASEAGIRHCQCAASRLVIADGAAVTLMASASPCCAPIARFANGCLWRHTACSRAASTTSTTTAAAASPSSQIGGDHGALNAAAGARRAANDWYGHGPVHDAHVYPAGHVARCRNHSTGTSTGSSASARRFCCMHVVMHRARWRLADRRGEQRWSCEPSVRHGRRVGPVGMALAVRVSVRTMIMVVFVFVVADQLLGLAGQGFAHRQGQGQRRGQGR